MTKKSGEQNNTVVASKKEEQKKEKSTPAELLAKLPEDMPPEMKRVVRMAMTQASFPGGDSRTHPLFDKFTEEHVHKYLDYIQRDDDFEHKLKGSNRWFHLGYTVLGIVFFGFLIVYLLPKDKALLNDILKLLIVFTGGVGSGYGLRSYIKNRK